MAADLRYHEGFPEKEDKPGIVDEFRQQLEELAMAVERLEQRLSPVLVPQYDDAQKVGAQMTAPAPVSSAVRDVLGGFRAQASRLRALHDRLEV